MSIRQKFVSSMDYMDCIFLDGPVSIRKYPLHYAVYRGSLKDTLDVLDKSADLQLKNDYGDTALHIAADGHMFDKHIIQVLAERTRDVNVKDVNGRTPLHRAVISSTREGIEILINNGADVNIQDDEGNAPLHYATLHFLNVVPLLIKFGANIDLPNKQGQTPLHIAAAEDYYFCTWNDKEVLIPLKLGANVNFEGNEGNTPLQAILCNANDDKRAAICFLLLKYGANIEKQNNRGQTPLLISIDRELKDCAALMLRCVSVKNAVGIPDLLGNLPLHVAILRNDIRNLKLLLDNGADTESKNNRGETALQVAINQITRDLDCEVPICELLLNNGANVNVKDELGMTPLHYAVLLDNLKIVAKLIVNGSNVNCRDKMGKTPLMCVGSSSVIQLLFMAGAKTNLKDNNRRTAIDLLVANTFISQNIKDDLILELLDLSAFPDVKDLAGRYPSDCRGVTDAIIKTVTKRDLVNLPSDLPLSHLTANINGKKDLKDSYLEACTEEVQRMKRERYEKHSIFDIFRQRENPTYVWNKVLKSVVNSDKLRRSYPIYGSLLESTFYEGKERESLFSDIISKFPAPLPSEVTRHILSFLDTKSLRNMMKALTIS